MSLVCDKLGGQQAQLWVWTRDGKHVYTGMLITRMHVKVISATQSDKAVSVRCVKLKWPVYPCETTAS